MLQLGPGNLLLVLVLMLMLVLEKSFPTPIQA